MNGTESLLLISFAIFWTLTFFSLMAMPDMAFKGRNDKLIMAILMIVLLPFGVFIFHLWRFSRRTDDLVDKEVFEVLASASSSQETDTEAT